MHHTAPIEHAKGAAQQECTNHSTRDIAKTIRGSQQDHHILWRGCHQWSQHAEQHLRARNTRDDERGSPRLLTGIEHTQVQQHKRVRDQGESRETECQAKNVSRRNIEVQVGKQANTDTRTEGGKKEHHRDQRDRGKFCCHRQVVHHGLVVTSRSIARQPRHNGRQQRHANNAIGHLQQQPRLLVDRPRRSVIGRSDAARNNQAELRNTNINNNGQRHATELLQAIINPPQGTQIDTRPTQRRHHDQRLHHHAQRGTHTQQQNMRIGNVHWFFRVQLPRQNEVQCQHYQHHNVVNHRCPRAGLKYSLCVQHRHEQREHAIEQNLREQQESERGGLGNVDLAAPVQRHTHQ